MIKVNYPEPAFRIKTENGREFIFDDTRRKWVALTAEEWVRQNFISYLHKQMQYPSALIAVEKELLLGEMKKRFDILVYDASHQPWLMVECKAPDVKLDESVLAQVLRYNITIPVPFMVITNGNQCHGFHKAGSELVELELLPEMSGR